MADLLEVARLLHIEVPLLLESKRGSWRSDLRSVSRHLALTFSDVALYCAANSSSQAKYSQAHCLLFLLDFLHLFDDMFGELILWTGLVGRRQVIVNGR